MIAACYDVNDVDCNITSYNTSFLIIDIEMFRTINAMKFIPSSASSSQSHLFYTMHLNSSLPSHYLSLILSQVAHQAKSMTLVASR